MFANLGRMKSIEYRISAIELFHRTWQHHLPGNSMTWARILSRRNYTEPTSVARCGDLLVVFNWPPVTMILKMSITTRQPSTSSDTCTWLPFWPSPRVSHPCICRRRLLILFPFVPFVPFVSSCAPRMLVPDPIGYRPWINMSLPELRETDKELNYVSTNRYYESSKSLLYPKITSNHLNVL